jgi:neutral trehalase
MLMDAQPSLFDAAKTVLQNNDEGAFTIPAEGLYPHQWLWDSCFVSIGLRHVDIDRAQTEIISLLRGQWANGMMPHMIFSGDDLARYDRNIWRSWLNPSAPDEVATSGITQPPMLAEAIVKIGEKMQGSERRNWYERVYPALVKYHEWLYADRDPHDEGLVVQIHPYETGLDNTPPWISQLRQHQMPWWATALEKAHANTIINFMRRDTRNLPPGQRMSNIEALLFYDVIRRIRRKNYDTEAILNRSVFAIEDLTFNSIFIRANRHVRDIAKTINAQVPAKLLEKMEKSEVALEQMWDAYAGQYFSRNFITHKLIKEPTVATLMPLYAGVISKERAEQLVKMIEDTEVFGPAFPIPSVPLNSPWFNPFAYWQGPAWVNINWLIIDGLRRYGFNDHADALTESTLEMVERAGFYEYFDPIQGEPAGAHNFSWTAALTIDLLKH